MTLSCEILQLDIPDVIYSDSLFVNTLIMLGYSSFMDFCIFYSETFKVSCSSKKENEFLRIKHKKLLCAAS